MSERFKLAPIVTSSRWSSALQAIWDRARQMRGIAHAGADRTVTPRLTNREAVALIVAVRELAVMAVSSDWGARRPIVNGKWPLWYQYAAIAYGWDPARDALNISAAQADKLYPIDQTAELWADAMKIADVMELDRSDVPARLELDRDAFDDQVRQGEVRKALREDGAIAREDGAAGAEWVIGFGGCKDPKTGKPGKPHRDKDGKWKCDPVVIEDPVTPLLRGALPIIILVVAVLALTEGERPRRLRR